MAKLRKKLVKNNGFWKFFANRPNFVRFACKESIFLGWANAIFSTTHPKRSSADSFEIIGFGNF
jgi:hypothetical protein